MTQQLELSEQAAHLNRVTARIGLIILDFCRENLGHPFHMEELRRYVITRGIAAPASPDRILRSLRQQGSINYEVLNRRASLYKILTVRP